MRPDPLVARHMFELLAKSFAILRLHHTNIATFGLQPWNKISNLKHIDAHVSLTPFLLHSQKQLPAGPPPQSYAAPSTGVLKKSAHSFSWSRH